MEHQKRFLNVVADALSHVNCDSIAEVESSMVHIVGHINIQTYLLIYKFECFKPSYLHKVGSHTR